MELHYTVSQDLVCMSTWKPSRAWNLWIFMEASLHRNDQSLTQPLASLLCLKLQVPTSKFVEFWPCQNEVEYLLPSYQFSEIHQSRQWSQTLYFLWEVHDHKSCCWCSRWRVKELYCQNGKVFSLDKVSGPTAECACYWVKVICIIGQGERMRECANLFRDANLWMLIQVLSDLERDRDREIRRAEIDNDWLLVW